MEHSGYFVSIVPHRYMDIFDMGETAFILYAAVYLALGIAAMLISILIRKKTQK